MALNRKGEQLQSLNQWQSCSPSGGRAETPRRPRWGSHSPALGTGQGEDTWGGGLVSDSWRLIRQKCVHVRCFGRRMRVLTSACIVHIYIHAHTHALRAPGFPAAIGWEVKPIQTKLDFHIQNLSWAPLFAFQKAGLRCTYGRLFRKRPGGSCFGLFLKIGRGQLIGGVAN